MKKLEDKLSSALDNSALYVVRLLALIFGKKESSHFRISQNVRLLYTKGESVYYRGHNITCRVNMRE